MDFLRLRLPGLHQALRGALDSFSAFVSYLIGDTVPTVERQTQAAEELGEVTAEKVVGEEAQEVLEGLKSGQSERAGAPEETIRCQEEGLAGKQTWGWRADSSTRPQAERQDTGSRKAAEGARGQEPLKPEAGPGTHRDRSDAAQERWEHGEEDVSSGGPLRTCEQKEEEEEVIAAEPAMARGVTASFAQPACHSQPEGNASTEGQNVTESSKELDWVAKDIAAEVRWFSTKGADNEEERMVPTRDGQSARAQGTQCSGEESEDWAMLSGEAWTVSGREGADSLGIQEAEYRSDPGDNIPEAPGRVWVLEEPGKGDQGDEVDEKSEAEVRLPIQTLETERTVEMTEDQIAGKGAVGDLETGGSFEDEERQDLAIRHNGVSLKEEVQAEESSREKSCSWATEAIRALDTEEGEPDWEDSPEASTEELSVGEKSEAAQMTPEVLRVKVAEGLDPELMRGSQTLTKQLEEGQKGQEETSGAPELSPEGMLSLKEYPRPLGLVGPELEAWGNWSRGMDRRNSQEENADAEAGKEQTAVEQAVEVQAEGGQEAQQPEGFRSGRVEELASIALNPELGGSQGTEAGTEQSVGTSKPTENEAAEEEAAVPWEADGTLRNRRLEEVPLGLHDSEDTQTSYLADEIIVGISTMDAEEGSKWEAGLAPETELGQAWYSEGRGDAGRGTKLEETTEKQSGQEVGMESSAEEKLSGYDIQEIDGTEEEEPAEMDLSVTAEELRGTEGVTLGSQAESAEGSITTVETEGFLRDQMLLKEEAGGGQSREPKGHNSEGEIRRLQEEEEAERTETQEAYPGQDDSSGQEGQQTHQIPTVAVPAPSESAEATAGAPGDVHSNWNEALLPGSRLDVSVPRSRVLLSRSSSRRRSRPSFHRISVPEPPPQCDPPSPQAREEQPLSEQSPLQLEETPELSATKPEGTPVPARRKMLGRGFGFAHPGMMQELQARLSQPKPQ
ncbi:apolipoprotein B receptor [Apodemus sylvaticus]|uniref:apolipoprotein B receptor n=1 Tax=Apodemus sylvaticus TaxID=10129 RepID=UPI0022429396|nr:apolipoprotein B receptor [Apodemus sylvaticus]XP_052055067.1 apolipoprotein B receptor [Apodemus sylvaticus]